MTSSGVAPASSGSGSKRFDAMQERIRRLPSAGGAYIPPRVIVPTKEDPRRVQKREPPAKSGAVLDENMKILSFLHFINLENFNDLENEYVKNGMEQLAFSLGRPGDDVTIAWVEMSPDLKIRLMLSTFRKGKRKIPIASNYFMLTKIAPLTPELLREFIKAYLPVQGEITAVDFYKEWSSRPDVNARLRAHTNIFKAFIPFYDYQRRMDSMMKHIAEQMNSLERKYGISIIPYQDLSEERKRAMEYNEKLIPPSTKDKKWKSYLHLLATANLDRYDVKTAIVRLSSFKQARDEIEDIFLSYFYFAKDLGIDPTRYQIQLNELIAEGSAILPFDLFELLSTITFREMGMFNQLEPANNLPLLAFDYTESTRLNLLKIAFLETGRGDLEDWSVDELRLLILQHRLLNAVPFKRSFKIADRIIEREIEMRKADEKAKRPVHLLTPEEILEKIHYINRLAVLQDDISVQTLIGKTVSQLQDLYSELGKNEREILIRKIKEHGEKDVESTSSPLSISSLYTLLIQLQEKNKKPIKIVAPIAKHIRRDVLDAVKNNRTLTDYLELPMKNKRVDDTKLRMRVRAMFYSDNLPIPIIINLLSTQEHRITLKDIDLWISHERDLEWEKDNKLDERNKRVLIEAYESVLKKIKEQEGESIGRPYKASPLRRMIEPTPFSQWDTSRIPKRPLRRMEVPKHQRALNIFQKGMENLESEINPLVSQIAKQYLLKVMKILRTRLQGLYYYVKEGESAPMLDDVSDAEIERYVSNLVERESLAPFATAGDLFLFVGKLITLSFFNKASGKACESVDSNSCIIPLFPTNVEFAREFLNLRFSVDLIQTRVDEYVGKISSLLITNLHLLSDVSKDHRNAMGGAYSLALEKVGTITEQSEQLIPDSMYIPMFHKFLWEERDKKKDKMKDDVGRPVMVEEERVEEEREIRKSLEYDAFGEEVDIERQKKIDPSVFPIPDLFEMVIRRVNTFADVDIHPLKSRSVSPTRKTSKGLVSPEAPSEGLVSPDREAPSEGLVSPDKRVVSPDKKRSPKKKSPKRSKKEECNTQDCCVEECKKDAKDGVSSLVPDGDSFRIVRFCSLECMKNYNFKKAKKEKDRPEDEISLEALRRAIKSNSNIFVHKILRKASEALIEEIRADPNILKEAYEADDDRIYRAVLKRTKMKPLVILGEEKEEKETVLPLDKIIQGFNALIEEETEPDNNAMIKLVKKIDVTEKSGAMKVSQSVFNATIFDWLKLAVKHKNDVMSNYLRQKLSLTTEQLKEIETVLPVGEIVKDFDRLIEDDESDNDEMIALVKKFEALKVRRSVFDEIIFDWLKLTVKHKNVELFNHLKQKVSLTTEQFEELRKIAKGEMLELIVFDWFKLAVRDKNVELFNYLRKNQTLQPRWLEELRKIANGNATMLKLINSKPASNLVSDSEDEE